MDPLPVIIKDAEKGSDEIVVNQFGNARLLAQITHPEHRVLYVSRGRILNLEMPPTDDAVAALDRLIANLEQFRTVLQSDTARSRYERWGEQRQALLTGNAPVTQPHPYENLRVFLSKTSVRRRQPTIHFTSKTGNHPGIRMQCGITKISNCIEYDSVGEIRTLYPAAALCLKCGIRESDLVKLL
jgi:hypothetical protein